MPRGFVQMSDQSIGVVVGAQRTFLGVAVTMAAVVVFAMHCSRRNHRVQNLVTGQRLTERCNGGHVACAVVDPEARTARVT